MHLTYPPGFLSMPMITELLPIIINNVLCLRTARIFDILKSYRVLPDQDHPHHHPTQNLGYHFWILSHAQELYPSLNLQKNNNQVTSDFMGQFLLIPNCKLQQKAINSLKKKHESKTVKGKKKKKQGRKCITYHNQTLDLSDP